ncbi:hypothetical protein BaRGS_00027830 [Batillaria attramentaria]|uniref:GH16 domain-containing protein n=1 Tax=Batillaria attramentaria TaxID=370345 RepID=A0ABD0K0R4_9CAEN
MCNYVFVLFVVGSCLTHGSLASNLNEAQTGDNSDDPAQDERSLVLPESPRYLQRRATTVLYDDFSSEPENSYVKNGVLYIRPTLTVDHFGDDFLRTGDLDAAGAPCHLHGKDIHPVMSAMLRSYASIRYGKVEIVAKLAKGDWLWNALWMMPKAPAAYGGWPRSGEFDLLEAAGNRHYIHGGNGKSAGIDAAHSTIHYGASTEHELRPGNTTWLHGTTFGDGFHKYWLDWTESHAIIGIDDHPVVTLTTPHTSFWQDGHFPGDNFFLIMNVAVGGDMFWDGWINSPYPKPWTHGAAEQMHQFWAARHLWYPTWHGEDAALQIRSVKMQQY